MKRTKGFISIFFKEQGMRKVFMSLIFAVSLVVFLSFSGTASGATLYVGPGEAYTEIQPAISAATNGDTIIVRDGIYTGDNNKNLDFGGRSITLKSENGAQNCIIDCQNSGRGFYILGGGPVVDGFTIRGGKVTELNPSSPEPYEWGGGILCVSASPTITNCIITNNYAHRGGGIDCYSASPLISNCTISGNVAEWGYGGGIHVSSGSPSIRNCMITNNTASWNSSGGGISLFESSSQIINCTISGNVAGTHGYEPYGSGGAIHILYNYPTITNCILWDNSAHYGPGIRNSWATTTIQHSDIDPDWVSNQGGTVNWGDGNINADPLFVGGGDYHLQELSPCVDAGIDAGVYTDIDGDTRPYDVPNWNKDGTGDEFDMGADEFATPLNEPPFAVCKDIEISADENCQASIVPEDVDGGSYDPDDDPITLSIDNIGPLPLGGTSVSLTVTDESGESDTCQAMVTVVDPTPPIPDVTPLPTLTGECSVTIPSAPTATDNCAGIITGTTSDPLEYTEQSTYTVTWTYDDGNGNTTTQTQTVVVDDVTAPKISVSVSPNILRPPNHKMVLITPTIMVSDNCDLDPGFELTSITTNEGDETNTYDPNYDSTLGDGHTINDIQVINGDVYLRAERSGKGTGRIYTITYTATDASDNSATATVTVTVPHD